MTNKNIHHSQFTIHPKLVLLKTISSQPAFIAVAEDGNFTFGSFEDSGNIFLVCKYNHQRYQYSKDPV